MANDEERGFRLGPRKPAARSEHAVWVTAYKTIMHYARMTSRHRRLAGKGCYRSRPHFQRCAVRVIYTKNRTAGQWRAHGRYLVRESVAFDGGAKGLGFDEKGESVEVADRLQTWQRAGDERLWKLIVSPEFGDRADLKKLTRDLLSRMEEDLGTPFEWVAVAHYNTEHPHVHVALRGIGAGRRPLRLSRDYVRQGIREIAENLCTRQLGYRSHWDAAEAQRHEVHEHRYTSLDRVIKRDGMRPEDGTSTSLTLALDPNQGLANRNTRLAQQHMTERLLVLEAMGLAEHAGPNLWRIRGDFEDVLRAMQRSADRQKTLAAHEALMSDERLPLIMLDLHRATTLEGRILVHGEEESGRQAGRSYLMLEGTDGQVYYVYYTPEMEAGRNLGGVKTNSFVHLRKSFSEGHPVLEIDELGDAEAIPRNERYLRETVQRLVQSGMLPQQDGWNGWLGRYQKALHDAAVTLEGQHFTKRVERDKNRDRGRQVIQAF